MSRRLLLQGIAVTLLVNAGIVPAQPPKRASAKDPSVEDLQRNWRKLLDSNAKVAADASPLVKTDEEWRQMLDPAAYAVLRHEATERPFTSPLNLEHRAGVFVCPITGLTVGSGEVRVLCPMSVRRGACSGRVFR